jgi:hypothetical protein
MISVSFNYSFIKKSVNQNDEERFDNRFNMFCQKNSNFSRLDHPPLLWASEVGNGDNFVTGNRA